MVSFSKIFPIRWLGIPANGFHLSHTFETLLHSLSLERGRPFFILANGEYQPCQRIWGKSRTFKKKSLQSPWLTKPLRIHGMLDRPEATRPAAKSPNRHPQASDSNFCSPWEENGNGSNDLIAGALKCVTWYEIGHSPHLMHQLN